MKATGTSDSSYTVYSIPTVEILIIQFRCKDEKSTRPLLGLVTIQIISWTFDIFIVKLAKLDRLASSCGRHAKMKLSISATITQIIAVVHRGKVDYLTKPCCTGSGYHMQDAGWLSNCWILEKRYKNEPNCNGHAKDSKDVWHSKACRLLSVLVIIQHLSAVGQARNQSDSGQVCQLIGGLISGLSMCPWARLQLLVS